MDIAGKLDKRITIQRSKEIEDENGVSENQWQDIKTVWARANNLYGKEYWDAKQYNAENTTEFIIRYNACKDISVKDRIKFRDRIFNIKSVDNVMYKDESIKIKAEEVM